MRVLVTGACGFVGPYLVKELSASGAHEVTATVFSKEAGERASCRGEKLSSLASQIVELDVTDPKLCGELIGDAKPEMVFHLAGMAFAPDAASNFSQAIKVNVTGVFHVCEALLNHAPNATFLFVSSGEVYGKVGEGDLPLTESKAPLPMNPYSLTKLQAEEVVRLFARRAPLRAIVARPFNHIGPGQSEKFVCSSFAAQLARIAHGKQAPCIQVGNLEAKRDFLDVRDVVRGYVALMDASSDTFNLSSGSAISIQQILDTLIEVSGLSVEVQSDPSRMRPSEVPEIRGSYEKIENALGWKPQHKISDSLKDVYEDWYQRVERE